MGGTKKGTKKYIFCTPPGGTKKGTKKVQKKGTKKSKGTNNLKCFCPPPQRYKKKRYG